MNAVKSTVKTIMHYSSSLLVILVFILSIMIFIMLPSDSKDSAQVTMLIITSSSYLGVSSVLILIGILLPKIEVSLSKNIRNQISGVKILTGIFSLLKGDLLHGLHSILDYKTPKSVRANWNAPFIFIASIFLFYLDFLTAGVIAAIDTLNPIRILEHTIIYPCGQLLIAQLIIWILLSITAFVWYYLDTKSSIPLPDNLTIHAREHNKRTLIQCLSCGTVFHYELYEGICPKCGHYNQFSENTNHLKNQYKRKKTVLELFKTYGMIILIFSAIITIAIIKQRSGYKDDLKIINMKLPALNHQTEVEDARNSTAVVTFTTEDINSLLEEIKIENSYKTIYHKELYEDNLTDTSGEKYNKLTILTASDENEKVYWYQYFKYLETSKNHNAGEIEFYMGAESSSITKTDILGD